MLGDTAAHLARLPISYLRIPGASTREGATTAPSVTRAETPDGDFWRISAEPMHGLKLRGKVPYQGAPSSSFFPYPLCGRSRMSQMFCFQSTREGKRSSFKVVRVKDKKL